MGCSGLVYVLLFLKCCEILSFQVSNQICYLEDKLIGKCVPVKLCFQNSNRSTHPDSLTRTCEAGYICCRISARIVTPDNGNSIPLSSVHQSAAFPQAASATASPQWVSVTPTVVNPSTGAGNPPANGGTAPNGNTTPNGSAPPSGSAPPNGSAPPSGSAPPNGGAPPSGGAPSGGSAPPNGSSPPGGTSGGQGPPPLMGNIVAEPVPTDPKSLPPSQFPSPGNFDPSDTIVISAEVIDNAIDFFDKKCELYHSMTQTEPTIPVNQENPIVMIYGGENTKEKDFPHMAALGYGDLNNKQWLCGGSLIAENFVVTAAHCLSTQPLGPVRYVKLGTTQLDQDTSNTQLLNVINQIPHEQYDARTNYYDIALLQLDRNVQITSYVLPICLFSSTNYEDRNLIATGWGKTESGSASVHLKKVALELFSQTECQNAYSPVSKQQLPLGIQESIQLCAGSHSQIKDTCQGDSGGPLQIRKNNRWYLIGLTSVGMQCGVANVPGVYTRVAYFLNWIQQHVWNK